LSKYPFLHRERDKERERGVQQHSLTKYGAEKEYINLKHHRQTKKKPLLLQFTKERFLFQPPQPHEE